MAKKQKKSPLPLIAVLILVVLGIWYLNSYEPEQAKGEPITFTGDELVVSMKVDAPDYLPSTIVVEKDRPTKLVVNGDRALGCMKFLVIEEVGIDAELEAGENVFQFTPTRLGEFQITCSMGMGEGTLKVVEKVEEQKMDGHAHHIMADDHSSHHDHFHPGQGIDHSGTLEAKSSTIVTLKDGDTFELSADFVKKEIAGVTHIMYGYNGMIPGPAIKVEQDSTITVEFTNNIDWDTTIHWHGLRHDIANDGVPGVSQDPVKPGESHTYQVYFPDAGVYWYHPHIREDIQQDSGLAGNMLVNPSNPNYWNSVNREELIVLDDIYITDGEIYPFGKDHANHAIMGRFGNVMLTNGDEHYNLEVRQGEVVRFYVTNVANVRPFNFHIEGVTMKLVGGDLSAYEDESFVDSVIITPAERYIVEAHFPTAGEFKVMHTHDDAEYELGTITVKAGVLEMDHSSEFSTLGENEIVKADVADFIQYFDKEIDYTLTLDVAMPGMEMEEMHMEESIEWEDNMRVMNQMHTGANTQWIIRDQDGNENMDVMLGADVGDKVKIRIFNDPDSLHPMQHPIHFHGVRFLVLETDGVKNENFVWKDTVLVPVGSTVDILVDVTNPGEWMIHCHIAEHLEAGMMAHLHVK